jgi:hypothetical protein
VLHAFERLQRLLDRIGNALDRHPPCPALHAAVEGLRQDTRAGLRRDAARQLEALLAQRGPGDEQHRRLAGAQRARGFPDGVLATRARCGIAGTTAGPVPSSHAVSPGRIRVATCPGGVMAAAIAAAPSAATRRRVGEVAPSRRTAVAAVSMSEVSGAVVLAVIGRVVADDVDHRRRGLAGVVQVGEAVREAGPRCSSVAAGFSAMRA